MAVRIVAVIPARMASRRLPGKPLLEVRGMPMIEHVRRRVLRCEAFAEVVVATCDSEIADVVRRWGGQCLMTSPHHAAATDRVAEAARQMDCTHVVNVQGDEVLVLPSDLSRMVDAIEAEPNIPAWNAVARIERVEELADRSIVKGALSASGQIVFCTRDFSALALTAQARFEPIRRVLGILAFRRDFLERYVTLPRTPIEQVEALDQSRMIEHDVPLRAVEFSKAYPGINEPREVALVNRILAEDQVQQALLETVLR